MVGEEPRNFGTRLFGAYFPSTIQKNSHFINLILPWHEDQIVCSMARLRRLMM